MARRKILFQHIPKTAGTTLIEQAVRSFGDSVCPARYGELTDAMIDDDAFVFYHGHMGHALVRRFRERQPGAFVFAFVRHPFARTLSQYYNWTDRTRVTRELEVIAARSGRTPHFEQLAEKFERSIFGISLDDFLLSDDPDVCQIAGNLQAQYLTDLEKPDFVRLNRAPFNAIATYDFVGLSELLDPCLRIVEQKCGLPMGMLTGGATKNSSAYAKVAGRYEVTASQLALLERCNTYDMAVFHACHALLLKLYGDLLPARAADIDAVSDLPAVVG